MCRGARRLGPDECVPRRTSSSPNAVPPQRRVDTSVSPRIRCVTNNGPRPPHTAIRWYSQIHTIVAVRLRPANHVSGILVLRCRTASPARLLTGSAGRVALGGDNILQADPLAGVGFFCSWRNHDYLDAAPRHQGGNRPCLRTHSRVRPIRSTPSKVRNAVVIGRRWALETRHRLPRIPSCLRHVPTGWSAPVRLAAARTSSSAREFKPGRSLIKVNGPRNRRRRSSS